MNIQTTVNLNNGVSMPVFDLAFFCQEKEKKLRMRSDMPSMPVTDISTRLRLTVMNAEWARQSDKAEYPGKIFLSPPRYGIPIRGFPAL
jgi:hypothetical protein